MLITTEPALVFLGKLLHEANAPEYVSVRIEQAEGSGPCKMKISRQETGDMQFRHHGRTVLVLDKQTGDSLDEETLDVEQTEKGNRLVLR